MSGLFARSALRELLAHPLQAGLALLGVALGVAVALSIQLTSSASLRAMEFSAKAVGGRATHTIEAGPSGLAMHTFTRLRVELSVRPSAPVLEEYVPLADRPGEVLRLVGIDPFLDAPLRGYLGSGGLGVDLRAFFTEPGAVLMARDTRERLGLQIGDPLAVAVGARTHTVRVIGELVPPAGLEQRLLEDLLVADLATAQELLDAPGRISRIDLLLSDMDPAEERRYLDGIRRFLPADATLAPAGARAGALAAMTRGFRLNLQALSFLSLLVGLFLVYNAALFSVVRRSGQLATLRCIGATRAQVLRMVLFEAALLGLAGSALGLALGTALARGLLGLVTRTINDLYFALEVNRLEAPPMLWIGALLAGLATTLAGALPPALEASRADPRGARRRSQTEERARRALPRFALFAAVFGALGALLLRVSGTNLAPAFAGLFAVVMGAALSVPPLAYLLLLATERPLARALGAPGAMAARGATRSLSRTSVALSALVVALSTSVAVGVLIASFRTSVITWLESAFTADVYASTPTRVRTRAPTEFPTAALAALQNAPQVDRILRYRNQTVPSEAGEVLVVALDSAVEGAVAFQFQVGGERGDLEAFRRGEALFITEPLAHRRGLTRGDRLSLNFQGGTVALPIAAIVHDYGSDRGNALLDLTAYQRFSGDLGISSLGLWLREGFDPDRDLPALRAAIPAGLEVALRSNRGLREETLVVFDRTFQVTRVLRALTLLVALVGLVSALMALALDRARELAVLRALGLSPLQVYLLLGAQAVLLGLAAGLLCLPVGALVARVMIDVVNGRSFGWSLLAFEFGAATVAGALLLASLVAAAASLLPAWRSLALETSRALRQE